MTAAGQSQEIQWRCLKCLAVNGGKPDPPGTGPWTCRACGADHPAHPEALDAQGSLQACPACGCRDLYRQRDFNRKLGIAVVLVGAALAPYTMYLSIVGCVLIDVFIFSRTRDCVVCYHCHGITRGYPGAEAIPPFDLNTSDKYIDVERTRGW